ncbi:MAG: RHS repeat-associated core domain-containing protein, partial [Saprospiraceae bacterium]
GGEGATWNLTDTEILQESHYYPFGMAMDGAWQDIVNGPENNYLYNGKELNSDFGLDWLDYGARYYDAAIGRWGQVDPLAESMASWSPYNYTFNNPISYTDPDGRSPDWIPEIDDDNNLILHKEDGDNAETLWNFLGGDNNIFNFSKVDAEEMVLNMESTDFGIGGTEYISLGNDNAVSKANETISNFTGDQATNCFECSLDIARGVDLSIGSLSSFKSRKNDFDYGGAMGTAISHTLEDAGSESNLIFGQSVVTFGKNYFITGDYVNHAATFLGKSNDGTNYFFSKNGFDKNSDYGVFTQKQLSKYDYGNVMGWKSGDSGYYNAKNKYQDQ